MSNEEHETLAHRGSAPQHHHPLEHDDHHEGLSHTTTNYNNNRTTPAQSFLHLVKGYIGPGCLSLPWAVSQLGIAWGCVACVGMAYWTSYNCWMLVRLKRELLQQQQTVAEMTSHHEQQEPHNNNSTNVPTQQQQHHVTYPHVSTWLYGPRMGQFTTWCICVQQLSVCTVFLSFVGTNLQAVLEAVWEVQLNHTTVITAVLPAALALTFLPNLKALAPVMAAGTGLLLMGLLLLAAVIGLEWPHRVTPQVIAVHWRKAPLALCAILYAYEGICLILPVESAMAKPKKFGRVFGGAMVVAAVVFCLTAGLSVAAFGRVSSGSITAFLLEKYSAAADEQLLHSLLLAANAAVSLSVLVTYPLQLFPCFELVMPLLQQRQQGQFESVPAEHDDFVAADDAVLSTSSGSSRSSHSTDDPDGLMRIDDYDDSNTEDFSSAFIRVRVYLVLLTYVIAIAIPNVEAMISLAGALAGSSVGLLIPPALQLAWCRRQNEDTTAKRVESYILLVGGGIFLVIGTTASILDIAHIYYAGG